MLIEPNQEEELEVEDSDDDIADSGKGGGGSKVPLIVLIVLLLGAVGGAGFLFTQLDKTKKDLGNTRMSLSSANNQVASLEGEKETLISEKGDLEEKLGASNSELKQTKSSLLRTQKEKDDALAQLDAKTKSEAALKKQIDDLDKQLSTTSAQLAELEKTMGGSSDKVTELASAKEKAEGTIEKLQRLLDDANQKGLMAIEMQGQIHKMLGKVDAPALVRGTVKAVDAMERLVVIDTSDKTVSVGNQFVISNAKHDWLATVMVEKVAEENPALSIARVLRPDTEVSVVVGDVAIEVPAEFTKSE